jgi:hypothetical protein
VDCYAAIREEDSMGRRGGPGRRGYPAEFRRRVVDLLATGRKVADVARAPVGQGSGDLRLPPPGTDQPRARVRAEHLGTGRTGRGRAAEGDPRPKRRFRAIGVMATEGLPVQLACRVLRRPTRPRGVGPRTGYTTLCASLSVGGTESNDQTQ